VPEPVGYGGLVGLTEPLEGPGGVDPVGLPLSLDDGLGGMDDPLGFTELPGGPDEVELLGGSPVGGTGWHLLGSGQTVTYRVTYRVTFPWSFP
jgi:hypothetical protein